METLEQLQKILDDAPEGATHIDIVLPDECDILNYIDANTSRWWNESMCEWMSWGGVVDNTLRSLADIQRIVDLIKLNQEMHQQVNGYLHGEDWEHWQAFNQKRFEV